jgi:hypothetical protein
MRDPKLLLIAFLAVATAWQLCAQTASPELQRKALEVLRQAVAQQEAAKAAPAVKVTSPQQAPPAITVLPGTTVVQPRASQQRAQERPRPEPSAQGQTGWRPSTQVAPRVSSPRGAANAPVPPRAREGVTAARDTRPQVGQAKPPGTSVTPQVSSGPKTRQERLDELFQRYLADEITPAQYHEERRRILAGP